MDNSKCFFGDLALLEQNIKLLKKKGIESVHIAKAIEKKQTYILDNMRRAINEEGYSLIVEDIAIFLDIDEKQVRNNIVPKLDYIRVPEGAAEFFMIENNNAMNFLEMRIKKWKKLFISKKSFEAFLHKHLVMYCPYTTIRWSDEKNRFIPIGEGMISRPYAHDTSMRLVRKCNIAPIIKQRKINDLLRKTKNDITHARMLGLISAERLEAEMAYISECQSYVEMPVHNQEIKLYLTKNVHYKYYLYKEEEDKMKPLLSERKVTENDIRVKPTVLYWFVEV